MFEVTDKLGRKTRLTITSYELLIEKHPEIKNQTQKLCAALEQPELIKRSVYNRGVLLFYKLFLRTPVTKKYLTVVIGTNNSKGFVITAYFTDRIKEGEIIWKRD